MRRLPTKLRPFYPRILPLEGGWGRGGRSGFHPHATVGHPGPEPALPVDRVLPSVLEADKADAWPVVGEGVGDLGMKEYCVSLRGLRLSLSSHAGAAPRP